MSGMPGTGAVWWVLFVGEDKAQRSYRTDSIRPALMGGSVNEVRLSQAITTQEHRRTNVVKTAASPKEAQRVGSNHKPAKGTLQPRLLSNNNRLARFATQEAKANFFSRMSDHDRCYDGDDNRHDHFYTSSLTMRPGFGCQNFRQFRGRIQDTDLASPVDRIHIFGSDLSRRSRGGV